MFSVVLCVLCLVPFEVVLVLVCVHFRCLRKVTASRRQQIVAIVSGISLQRGTTNCKEAISTCYSEIQIHCNEHEGAIQN